MPLLSSPLPNYSGPYNVGTVDIEAPCDKRKIADNVLKSTGEPAFELQTVLFSVFYPAVKGAKSDLPKHLWVSKPIGLIAEGYARFAHINSWVTNNVFTTALWSLAGSTTIPANVDVPLLGASNSHTGKRAEGTASSDGPFPLIVFSHGMASSRTSYTQYCGELASRGYVVAAIEHRDGSAPGSVIMLPDGTEKNFFHINEDQLDPTPDEPEIKRIQLAFRQAEIEETVRVLREINAGKGAEVFKSNPRKEGKDLAQWKGRLDFDQVIVSGHSYGATGALQALKDAPSHRRPFKGGIILDPGKQSGPLNDDINVPTLVIHSDSWSKSVSVFFGRPHFEVVKALVEKVNKAGKAAWFLTSVGTSHPSVTDAPLIEPTLLSWTTGATIDVREGVLQYVKVSEEFMQYMKTGEKKGILKEKVTHPEYDQDGRSEERKKKMPKEIEKYWQIHVTPADVN